MKQPCDVNQPIQVLYKQIEDAIEFAATGQTPYSPAQVLNIAYQLVFRTGIFANDCKIWKHQPAPYKKWPQFKLDFVVAYQEYNEALVITLHAAGFSAEELAKHQGTIDAIANLATATAEDRRAVANLMETKTTLTKELATSNGKLVTALTLVNTLTKQLAGSRAVSNQRSPVTGTGERKHYCWTCGYRCEHSSWLCPTPAAGHETRAKAADTMNGSTRNKHRRVFRNKN
jgi:hypothetical protein